MRLHIVQVGEEVLRRKARELSRDEILSDETRELIQHMQATMRLAPGVGLAAPQVGMSVQLAVIEDREEYLKRLTPAQISESQRKPVPFQVIINPRIISFDGQAVEFFEGCLSLAGYSAIVPRARSVVVEYLDEAGESRRVQAAGWYARILQHEIDHLTGTLYLDRMQPRTLTTLESLERFWKDLPIADVQARLGIR
jgi:peptide deformylase